MIHDTTESEYAQLESIRIYIVLELEGTVLAENYLEVHTLHHRVAIVLIAYDDLVILCLVIYTIRRWSIHRVVTPEWADDVGIEGFCCWQTCWWLRELLVILYRCIERYETSIVDIHLLILLAIEWELEWKFHLLEVCLINIVCIRHVLSIVVGDVYPLVRYIEAIELRLEHIVYSRLISSLQVGSCIPRSRLSRERKVLIALVGYLDCLFYVGTIRSFNLQALWITLPGRITNHLSLQWDFLGCTVLIGDNEHIFDSTLLGSRQCYYDILALTCRNRECRIHFFSKSKLAVLDSYACHVESILTIVAQQDCALLGRSAEYLTEIYAGRIESSLSLQVVANDVGCQLNRCTWVGWVVGDNGEIVGQRSCHQFIVGCQCYLDFLAFTIAYIAFSA